MKEKEKDENQLKNSNQPKLSGQANQGNERELPQSDALSKEQQAGHLLKSVQPHTSEERQSERSDQPQPQMSERSEQPQPRTSERSKQP
jgi:hypothetical protein